jgi:hypothetical protein
MDAAGARLLSLVQSSTRAEVPATRLCAAGTGQGERGAAARHDDRCCKSARAAAAGAARRPQDAAQPPACRRAAALCARSPPRTGGPALCLRRRGGGAASAARVPARGLRAPQALLPHDRCDACCSSPPPGFRGAPRDSTSSPLSLTRSAAGWQGAAAAPGALEGRQRARKGQLITRQLPLERSPQRAISLAASSMSNCLRCPLEGEKEVLLGRRARPPRATSSPASAQKRSCRRPTRRELCCGTRMQPVQLRVPSRGRAAPACSATPLRPPRRHLASR